jgi:multidrug transporter EmrE-like cation transporter
MSYVYIASTILLTVYGQIVIKWQILNAGSMPVDTYEKIMFLTKLLLNPWIVSAFAAAFLASLFWMAAMAKLPLSHAYPFMSLAFVFVLIASGLLFHEPVTPLKVIGIVLITLGIVASSQG